MKFVTEFRDEALVHGVIEEIRRTITRPWTLMEICGGQTHAIMRYGLDQLLPPEIELVHGPGCPVCVTPLDQIDRALAIAERPDVIFTSFGDMLRVPGSQHDLFSIRARGGQVKVVYSPLYAVRIAQENQDKQVVFFAIGFESTSPPNGVQRFLAAGHVCSVMGYWEYPTIAKQSGVPMTITGFQPLDLVQGILMTVQMLEQGIVDVRNAYSRTVTFEGNQAAQAIIKRVFQPIDRNWRGIGTIPMSGWGLRPEMAEFDAETRFNVGHIQTQESELCIAGQ